MPQTKSIVASQDVNATPGKTPKNVSRFPLGRPNFGTYRFGEYGITDCYEVVPNDKISHRPVQEVQTYTLGAPLLQDVKLHQDAFFVPMDAILPNNWEKFFVNPVKGDDVPDDVNSVVTGFSGKLYQLFSNLRSAISNEGVTNLGLTWDMQYLILLEMFYSDGCLMSALGKHYAENFAVFYLHDGTKVPDNHEHDFGLYFDDCIALWQERYLSWKVRIQNDFYDVYPTPNGKQNTLGIRDFLCIIRDTFDWEVTGYTVNPNGPLAGFINGTWSIDYLLSNTSDEPFNFARLCAYQICCAHFYTNDKIDYVFTAQLYRQLIGDALIQFLVDDGVTFQPGDSGWFQVNSLDYQYDWLSGYFLDYVLSTGGFSSTVYKTGFEYLRLIFGYNYSLRYQDYFVGSRANPLAVGNVDVAVNNNFVNVIDITENILKQKFLNAVNRVGQRIENYTKELFGVEMDKDYHNPFWLFHTATSINSENTENTGDAQMSQSLSVTSRMFGATGNKQFNIHVDRAGVVIVLNYFDLTRLYCRSTDRQFFHVNRFDMFNPYLQFTGDQPIYRDELRSNRPHNQYFGYQGAYMEYKQRVPVCFGGFRYHLPGMAFVDDYQNARSNQDNISPSFIRSIPTELDRYYLKLEGYSLDTYWHFIIKNMNDVSAVRPMAYNPGILSD